MSDMSNKLVVRCVVELCAVLTDSYNTETLVNETMHYLESKGIRCISKNEVCQCIDSDLAIRLVCANKKNFKNIQKSNLILELIRSLWLYSYIGYFSNNLSKDQLYKELAQKFSVEKGFNPNIRPLQFKLFNLYKVDIGEDNLSDIATELKPYLDLLPMSFKILVNAIEERSDFEYVRNVYGLCSAKRNSQTRVTSLNSEVVLEGRIKKIQEDVRGVEVSLRDEIRHLNAEKHDLEMKLRFAKADVIRELIYSLTDYGWGCPLNELYLLLKNDNVPEKIKGIINNLFMALGEADIKLVKDKLVGQEIVLTEENQKSFDPYKYEEIFLGDKAVVLYPGYKCEHKVLINPVVRKTTKTKEEITNGD